MIQEMEHYKCTSCDYEWFDHIGQPVSCGMCGHMYVKWLSYDPNRFPTATKSPNRKKRKRGK